MVTPEGLISDLALRGYSVTKRRVLDWAQKGLLPHPERRGLGRGRGAVFAWRNAEVVGQAVAVCDLLAEYGRVRHLYVSLWLLGHAVPLAKVCEQLAEELRRAGASFGDETHTGEDVYGQLAQVAMAVAKRVASRRGSWRREADTIELLLSTFVGVWRPDEADLRASFTEFSGSTPGWEPHRILSLVEQTLSLPALRATLDDATGSEMERARADWQFASGTLRGFTSQCPMDPSLWPAAERRLAMVFGPWFLLVSLSVRQGGYGEMLDGWARTLAALNAARSGEEGGREPVARDDGLPC
jgi:hypothetical protein